MFGGIPRTSRDLLALARDWEICARYLDAEEVQERRRDIIKRVHAAGGYDLVGLFARMVGIPKKQAIALARALARVERKQTQNKNKKEVAELAEHLCGYGGGEARYRRRDTLSFRSSDLAPRGFARKMRQFSADEHGVVAAPVIPFILAVTGILSLLW